MNIQKFSKGKILYCNKKIRLQNPGAHAINIIHLLSYNAIHFATKLSFFP